MQMHNKIGFVIPWIGKFPNYFQLWLKTCAKNPNVDFLIFTDDHSWFDYPPNVKVNYIDLRQLKDQFQSHYDFPISLESAYKLCDYRPAYGELFSRYLTEYTFWGHCDIDLIWGDIETFITDDLLSAYDRVYTHGHCCLYRNEHELNARYRTLSTKKYQYWKNVFSSPKSCCFDEWGGHVGGGISFIFQENNIQSYDNYDFADIGFRTGYFKVREREDTANRHDLYFHWKDGTLFVCSLQESYEHEILYAHFQKRKLQIEPNIEGDFYVVAPGVVTTQLQEVKRHYLMEGQFSAQYQIKRLTNKVRGLRK